MPCVILITAIMSSTLLVQQGKSKLFLTFSGFIIGILLVYFLISIALVTAIQWLSTTVFGPILRIIFAVIMFVPGGWYIFDSFKEKSILFDTPEKLKEIFKKLAKGGTFLYTFALGFVFTFFKLPCIGGVFLALTYDFAQNPSTFLGSLALFYVGILLPIIILMLLIAFGVKTQKIDLLRVKYRPYLRIIAGLAIIALTIYSLTALSL